MRVLRFRAKDYIAYGIVDESACGTELEIVELAGDPLSGDYSTTGKRLKFPEVTVLAPVLPRSKIIGVGKNYHEHVAEMQNVTGGAATTEPLFFLKPNTSVIGPLEPIVLPAVSKRVEFEGELALVIGAVGKDVPQERAMEIVYGFTCANDVTARDLQIADGQWARAKGFDTFCPLGPVIETDLNYQNLRLETRLNGELRQRANTQELIHSLAKIVSHASSVWTLLPGDVILTGTPAGVGQLIAGDTVEVTIESIGTLKNPVVAAEAVTPATPPGSAAVKPGV